MRIALFVLVALLLSCSGLEYRRCMEAGGSSYKSRYTGERLYCEYPRKDAGKPCQGSQDCEGLCLCPDPEAELDSESAGECSMFGPDGTGTYCVIEGGRVTRQQIIVE